MTRFQPRDQIKAMSGYHSPQVDVPVRLNTNESPFGPPSGWLADIARITATVPWNRYPDRGATQLRAAIAARHGVSAENVFVANGSNEVLQTVFLAYAGPGRTIATFEPTYQMYAQIARVCGADVVEGERRADLTLDAMEIERVLERHVPAVSMLCNPNNPTGLVEPRENLETMLAATKGIVVVDEAYAEFSEWSAIDAIDEERPLVVTRTFSKTLSMAALRVGYAIAPKWVIETLNVAVLPYHLDSFKQSATVAALAYTDEMERRVEIIKSQRARIEGELTSMGVQVWHSGSNFVLFRPSGVTARQMWTSMLESGVLVRDCSSWPRLDGCLRVTVGTEEENSRFLEAARTALGTIRR